ncbi:MAG: 7-carboxy-7-deazaguanine synthase QueE [Legionella sp.]|nr:7-carboxy-7-deazaguanine synthase QueE [Legionella sp.]
MSRFLNQLRITEIFHSLQGESKTVGLPTVFVRLTGCPLRCQYCDSAYAFHGGKTLSLDEIVLQIKAFDCQYICITGGEPLAQPGAIPLLKTLCDQNYLVSLETSGARDISTVDKRVLIVMDLKTPDSLESDKNKWANLNHLKPTDHIKFVICSREDYEWAVDMITKHALTTRVEVLFSPSFEQLAPKTLAEWILKDKLPVRFQLQLHKLLWDDAPGH